MIPLSNLSARLERFSLSPRWTIAVFLFCAGAINYGDRAALSSVVPPLRQELGVTDAQFGFMGMLFLWSYALTSPFAGTIADRYPRQRVVVASLALWSLVMMVTGFTASVVMLCALRLMLGVAEAFYLPAAGALIADHHGVETRGRAVALHTLGLNTGIMLGGAFAGLLAEHYGWRAGFWVLGAAGIVLALFSPVFFRGATVVTTTAFVPNSGRVRETFSYLLRCKSFYAVLLANVVSGIASWIYFTWLPLYFSENYEMNLAAAGLTGAVLYKAPTLVGTAAGGWISDFLARRGLQYRVLANGYSFLISAPLLFLFLGVPSFSTVAAVLVLSSLIRAAGVPNEHPIICELVPAPFRATALGVNNMCGCAAGGLGVLMAGIFKSYFGLNTIFGASAVLYLAAGIVLIFSFHWWVAWDIERASQWSYTGKTPDVSLGRDEAANIKAHD